MDGRPCARARTWLLAAALASACGDDPAASAEAPGPAPPSDPAAPGKVHPAPASEVALGRTVLAALQQDDWDGYTNLLATRADMLDIHGDEARGIGREQRKRRRMVWRRVNQLRDGEAEAGWQATRSHAQREGLAWDAVRLVDVRREAIAADELPPGTTAARLELVLEHAGVERVLALGLCVRSSRGWVTLHPLVWREAAAAPRGDSLLGGSEQPGQDRGRAAATGLGVAPPDR